MATAPASSANGAHVLVLGAGSAGKRHARNLRELGCTISAFDPRDDRLDEIAKEGAVTGRFTSLDAALAASEYAGFMIASPPVYHVPQALQILAAQNTWVMCEKPLSVSRDEAAKLAPHAARILLTYTYRWWPPLLSFRRRLLGGEIGTVRNMRFVMSAHLADWHPWEKYQDFFMASRELGGGALLDESHFVDLMLWMLGEPERIYAQVDRISDLDIDSDDNVDILASYANGARVNLHLDLIGRPHERRITAIGSAGSLTYAYEENALRITTGASAAQIEPFTCERNEMFMGAAQEFVALMRGEIPAPSCTVADGVRVLALLDACRASSASGASVAL